MGEEVDPARMYQIKSELDESGIYLSEEVELWRGKVQAFLNPYAFMSRAVPCQDSGLGRLYMFL